MKLNLKAKELTMIALGAALMAVFSQIAFPIPFSTVPITLQTFGVVILCIILGRKKGVLALNTWLILGFIGLPVFANFKGGMNCIVGPTGGYIIGFIFMGYIIGGYKNEESKLKFFSRIYIGQIIQYAIGTIQMKIVLGLTMEAAILAGIIPFILKDTIVITIAGIVGLTVKNRLIKGNVLEKSLA